MLYSSYFHAIKHKVKVLMMIMILFFAQSFSTPFYYVPTENHRKEKNFSFSVHFGELSQIVELARNQ